MEFGDVERLQTAALVRLCGRDAFFEHLNAEGAGRCDDVGSGCGAVEDLAAREVLAEAVGADLVRLTLRGAQRAQRSPSRPRSWTSRRSYFPGATRTYASARPWWKRTASRGTDTASCGLAADPRRCAVTNNPGRQVRGGSLSAAAVTSYQ